MSKLVATFQKELQKVFHSDDYEKQKLAITHTFDKKQDALLDDMDATAAEYDFYVKRSDTSLYFLPLVNSEPLEEEALRSLSEEENEKIEIDYLQKKNLKKLKTIMLQMIILQMMIQKTMKTVKTQKIILYLVTM